MRLPFRNRWIIATLIGLFVSLSPQLHAAVDPAKLKSLRQQAEQFEQQADWRKACDLYETILRHDRNLPEIKERYQNCLRRYWQGRRHGDLSYRKEVLSLDYGQSLRLYTMIRDTLLDNALEKKKVDATKLFRSGLEELDNALTDPVFLQSYLAAAKPQDVRNFRAHLQATWGSLEQLTRSQALKRLREVTLAAHNALDLDCSVVIMEFACGACYALDEYTLYLTPNQLRELVDSLRGDFMPSISYHMQTENVGYLQVASFQDTTVQEIDDALADLVNMRKMKSLILDLRGNSGGLFEVSIEVARRFLTSGVITSTQNSDPKFSMIYHAKNPGALTLPLVVLIDGDTASAAEVLAGALKDNKRGKLVGQTTFGKGCTQCIVKLPPAPGGVPTGGMRLTVARFFSPDGHPYTGRGVVPHLLAERFAMSMNGMDLQLEQALIEAQRAIDMIR